MIVLQDEQIKNRGSSESSVLESMITGSSEQMQSPQKENASPASELGRMKTQENACSRCNPTGKPGSSSPSWEFCVQAFTCFTPNHNTLDSEEPGLASASRSAIQIGHVHLNERKSTGCGRTSPSVGPIRRLICPIPMIPIYLGLTGLDSRRTVIWPLRM
jgi:hypothetical protein